ncbi:zinc transporter 5-like [Mercurialis annua]|uniref:zinc transporter 5-like n=1 Tax=Mercurialis annua TaxID=3986 RepID=UPI00215F860B|nr:zinc transporter 5-like [Mercurialis annua]
MIKHEPFFKTILLILLLVSPILVSSSKCTCEEETQEQNTSQNSLITYKLIAIFSILVASTLGVSLPFLVSNISSLNPQGETFALIKAFAAGVILATGFMHILPDAIESLTSPCLNENPWRKFPFTGFFAMLSAIGTLMMETFASGYHKRSELRKAKPLSTTASGGEEIIMNVDHHHHHQDHDGHGNVSDFALERTNSWEVMRHRIVSQVLELGIVVHSVIIGLSLGVSQSSKTIRPLIAALSFHQFFEGMALGGCISLAKFKSKTIVTMILFFSMTTPSGIAVGIGISKMYNSNSPTSLIVEGILNSLSAGILIYMALVDLLANDFMTSLMLTNFRLQLGANLTLLLGACSMSLLAKW